jgi:hypothetical protein
VAPNAVWSAMRRAVGEIGTACARRAGQLRRARLGRCWRARSWPSRTPPAWCASSRRGRAKRRSASAFLLAGASPPNARSLSSSDRGRRWAIQRLSPRPSGLSIGVSGLRRRGLSAAARLWRARLPTGSTASVQRPARTCRSPREGQPLSPLSLTGLCSFLLMWATSETRRPPRSQTSRPRCRPPARGSPDGRGRRVTW